MTGVDHYSAGESDLDAAARSSDRGREDDATFFLQRAQAHFTASLAAATALGHLKDGGPMDADRTAWVAAASEHPGQLRRIREAEAAELAEYAKEPQS